MNWIGHYILGFRLNIIWWTHVGDVVGLLALLDMIRQILVYISAITFKIVSSCLIGQSNNHSSTSRLPNYVAACRKIEKSITVI